MSANVTRLFSGVQPTVVSNEVDSKGNQVFLVTPKVDSVFVSLNTFNYIKVKGPFHLKQRMCLDKQNGKLSESTRCDINFFRTDNYIYDFSEYTLLAGDVDQNGIINIVDYSLIKSSAESDSGIECGKQNDLNMDGMVNVVDVSMIESLLLPVSGE